MKMKRVHDIWGWLPKRPTCPLWRGGMCTATAGVAPEEAHTLPVAGERVGGIAGRYSRTSNTEEAPPLLRVCQFPPPLPTFS